MIINGRILEATILMARSPGMGDEMIVVTIRKKRQTFDN